ncbi:hypothetical protein OCU04_004014 [Sclerotinia nivalis]|uniref:Uncharacterized protein n=1 Tax=Sclerotinia nivalis TaxID=352851 RepID=A0A9X0AT65_9HELO|nr:hypothetical protein OCU04_004014 [Sclerotinia nivalis]
MSKRAPSPIPNPPVDDEVREEQKEARRQLVKWYGDIRLALEDREEDRVQICFRRLGK